MREGPVYTYDTEVTAVGFLNDLKLAIVAVKGLEIMIREVETRGVVSRISWNKSIVWAIYEHQKSRNFRLKHYCFYIVHNLGVDLLEHDGTYRDLKITQKTIFGDLANHNPVVQTSASYADFDQTKL